jgi:hypothetical protein
MDAQEGIGVKKSTKLGGVALAGVLALGSLTGCNWPGGDDECDTDALAAVSVLAKPGPGGGGGGGKGGGAKGGGANKGGGNKGKAPKTGKGNTGGGGTTGKKVDDHDCDED